MKDRLLGALTLLQVSGFGPRRVSQLMRGEGFFELLADPRKFEDLLSPKAIDELVSGAAEREARGFVAKAHKAGLESLIFGSPDYPVSLAALYDPPPVLWKRGSIERAPKRRVAIVGSRGATPAGKSFARNLARGLAQHGVEIVSGLARGIDGAAHQGVLEGGGTTLAVLGSGADVIYPREHDGLATKIAKNGAILSEVPPGTSPAPENFPKRNRIIVGLSDAVIVVEAAARSGALITARVALEEGRDVMAVPGRPWDPLSEGPNGLIRDGAALVRSVDDVLHGLGISPSREADGLQDGALQPNAILGALAGFPGRSLDQIIEATRLAAPLVLSQIASLEAEGKVERLPGTLFRATNCG